MRTHSTYKLRNFRVLLSYFLRTNDRRDKSNVLLKHSHHLQVAELLKSGVYRREDVSENSSEDAQ